MKCLQGPSSAVHSGIAHKIFNEVSLAIFSGIIKVYSQACNFTVDSSRSSFKDFSLNFSTGSIGSSSTDFFQNFQMNSFGNFLLSGLSRYHSKNRLRSFSYDSSNRIFFSKILNSNLSWCLSRDFPQIQVSIPLGICPESSGSCHLKAPTDFFITVSY